MKVRYINQLASSFTIINKLFPNCIVKLPHCTMYDNKGFQNNLRKINYYEPKSFKLRDIISSNDEEHTAQLLVWLRRLASE